MIPYVFRPQYGKDFYYRAHPEDLKKFYAAVDEFHTAYDSLTEFESLSGVAADLLPGGCGACACLHMFCIRCHLLCIRCGCGGDERSAR